MGLNKEQILEILPLISKWGTAIEEGQNASSELAALQEQAIESSGGIA